MKRNEYVYPRSPTYWILEWLLGRITEREMTQMLRRLGVEP